MKLVLTSLLFVALLPPDAALAADGVLEIDQACALAGCFAGDIAGFPVTITTPGSYRLTSNLDPGNVVCRGITISATPVEVDLGGFTVGPIASGCPANAIDMITVDSSITREAASVRNGSVTGSARDGLVLGPRSLVERVHARQNQGAGISVGEGSRVVGAISERNGGIGILAAGRVEILDSAASLNGSHGIWALQGATVDRCASSGNSGRGFSVSAGSTVTRSSATDNTQEGFVGANGVTFAQNAAWSNDGSGFQCATGCVVSENASTFNTGYGFDFFGFSGAAYSHVTAVSNTVGGVNGGTNRNDNYCFGTGVVLDTCP